jgi:hypothetical protein
VYAVLGTDYDNSPYTRAGERVARLAVSGIRLVIDEFRTDVTKTLQNGSKGKLRIDYADPRDPEQQLRWMWRFIDGAKTAGELYGRALVVIAAEQYASRLVVPTSSGRIRRAGARTRTTPAKRCASSQGRIYQPASSSRKLVPAGP